MDTTTAKVFPGLDWAVAEPAAAGMSEAKLERAQAWLDRYAEGRPYRTVVVRAGRIVAEWHRDSDRQRRERLASAAKSVFSCVLGVAIGQGVIPSADTPVADVYPEALDVPPGAGPKAGRHAFPKDRAITFRQLISNTSGYMKPGEEPGTVFHYQTYGMNILTHAIAKACGLYDVDDPEGSPGLRVLVDRWLREPIGADWGYYQGNFALGAGARLGVFGYYDGIAASARDMARLGWLWCSSGRWGERQVVPRHWMDEATSTAPAIREHCPPEEWRYGYGFWTNDHASLWPSLPRDAFAASGAGRQHIAVFPGLELVVVQSPGLADDQFTHDSGLLRLLVDACVCPPTHG